jgi:hypothetical protein
MISDLVCDRVNNRIGILFVSLFISIAFGYYFARRWWFNNYQSLGYTLNWRYCTVPWCDYCPHETYKKTS